ncbi:MAG TPA: PIN domain-containing protein [Tepidisphaeraceae bacterium]
MKVFLDTVGVLALWDSTDQWHAPAAAAFTELTRQQADLTSTTLVLMECANAAARRPYRLTVERLWQSLKSSGRLIIPTDEDIDAAWTGYRRGDADQAGFVDNVSFVVMRRLGITHSFTNDRHFRAAGFQALF